ncbi:hypothetical protein C9374_000307 [Naegleria lovaniensis]|uniref:General stress protein FMN-binding split barrel domain-containing protein n=1 Tax=Naegleria lovaniensis TaxID=51637 RepID=A0AA88KNY4_NAELO|nr:uncharacterized protein C9374_000307 [Naegleria lovaniensis]KAG2388868.1 hypothetical protein C9374_000307 [Naegleria lovaniensis]
MPEQSIEKLKSLIKDIKYCMLATWTTSKLGEKYIHSRPMNVLWKEDALAEQKLYLFSSKDSWKNKEIGQNHEVNLAFSDPNNQTYVSLACTCYCDDSNRELMKELWNPYCEIYFPKGVNDPNLCLLVCDIHHAEYWDVKQGSMMSLITSYIKAGLGIKEPISQEHEKVVLQNI